MKRWIIFILIALFALLLTYATVQAVTPYLRPTVPAQMSLYTPEGYRLDFWVFKEPDASCTVEFSLLATNVSKVSFAHGKVPCEAWALFFQSIRER